MDESRRDVIRKGALGAGLVWAAPKMNTLRLQQQTRGSTPPTSESTTSPTTAPECAPCFAAPEGTCHGSAPACDDEGLGTCRQAQTVEGDCFCAANVFTSFDTCTSSSQCGPGQRCMKVCFPDCTTAVCLDPCLGVSRTEEPRLCEPTERPDGTLVPA
jgi:hypothetical protein